jgi:succinate dehydrogenase / fumarate reductase membrane anchor subunit
MSSVKIGKATHHGGGHWLAERATSIALIPLSLWFVVHVIGFAGASFEVVHTWLATPWNMALMACLVGVTFHHMNAGLQAVIDDYVHLETARIAALMAVKGVCFLLALASVLSILKIGL